MKRSLKAICFGVLCLGLWFTLAGCKKPAANPGTNPPAPAQPAPSPAPNPNAPAAQGAPAVPAAAPIAPEEYWKIQIERLDSIKNFLTQQLAIYKKYGGNTAEAQKEIQALRTSLRDQLQTKFSSSGVSRQDFFATRPEDRQERDKYRQDHADVSAKFQALDQDIRSLRQQIRDITRTARPGAANPETPAALPGATAKPETPAPVPGATAKP